MYEALTKKAPAITDRQRQVVELVAAGLSNQEIGEQLQISPRTVKAHCDVLRQKLGVSRRRQLPVAYRLLTRLLDETSARIILLVAPAGYGKTTLAREWCSSPGRQSAWYQCTPASADVAAFTVGLTKTIRSVVLAAGKYVDKRARVTTTPS